MNAQRTTARGVVVATLVTACLAACGADPDGGADPASPPTTAASPTAPSSEPTESEATVSPSSTDPSLEPTEEPAESGDGSGLAPFAGRVDPIDADLRERMRGAGHRAGCPVGLDDLRVLTVSYVDFDGASASGRIVVAAEVADDVVGVFQRLYDARFPLRRLRTIDAYGGDDDASMADDNSSGYNCRTVAGTDRWSDHSLGTAIDLNPVENPYVTAAGVYPPAGRAFADIDRGRGAQAGPGVIVAGDVVVRAFADIGWEWGGTWTSSKDYQHFSLSGR